MDKQSISMGSPGGVVQTSKREIPPPKDEDCEDELNELIGGFLHRSKVGGVPQCLKNSQTQWRGVVQKFRQHREAQAATQKCIEAKTMSKISQNYINKVRRIFNEAILRDERMTYKEYMAGQVGLDASLTSDTAIQALEISKLIR